ncbi:hypothetical protein LDENG_00268530 [Lucifuga dentata]|nr:hypothetical protein LDENG_00268530 [Lucifuga dentata]
MCSAGSSLSSLCSCSYCFYFEGSFAHILLFSVSLLLACCSSEVTNPHSRSCTPKGAPVYRRRAVQDGTGAPGPNKPSTQPRFNE